MRTIATSCWMQLSDCGDLPLWLRSQFGSQLCLAASIVMDCRDQKNLGPRLQTKTWLDPPCPSSRPRRYPWKLKGGDPDGFTSATSQ